ncbi:MAG TPA: hypothetical protein VK037_06065 [Pseudogracilibacillus sp.]|nr:hypothetical protein [Pseudogracilibacillus sp.]
MKRTIPLIFISLLLLIVSGCLYPQSELAKHQEPQEEQLQRVQEAVLQYKEQTNGLMPIHTTENDVPRYEKYIIDFTTLRDAQLLNEIPGTAFENGGYYQYVIITPEEDPRVKLIDLRITEKLREVNVKLDIYRQKHLYPPYGEQIAPDIYQLNYEKLGLKEEPIVVSPYSNEQLPILITTEGQLIVDYRLDLQLAIEEYGVDESSEDIRYILEDNYPFVPAYSVPYIVEDGEPIFNP